MRRTPSAPLRFVAAAHAVTPWAFPGYHDESHAWLKFLDESHVRYYAELRDVSLQFVFVNLWSPCSTRVATGRGSPKLCYSVGDNGIFCLQLRRSLGLLRVRSLRAFVTVEITDASHVSLGRVRGR